jgi:hypothetical protein
MRRWIQVTPPTLEYTMKVWQLVTHPAASPTYRRMKNALPAGAEPGFFGESAEVEEGWRRSLQCAQVLGATAMLFQCPASFSPDPENVLPHAPLLRAHRATTRATAVGAARLRVGETTRFGGVVLPGSRPRARCGPVRYPTRAHRRGVLAITRNRRGSPFVHRCGAAAPVATASEHPAPGTALRAVQQSAENKGRQTFSRADPRSWMNDWRSIVSLGHGQTSTYRLDQSNSINRTRSDGSSAVGA